LMFIKKISLRSVRNYRKLDLELAPGLNLFHGDNGEGKTNLLEAVGLLTSLRSFRGVKAASAVAWGEKALYIKGEAETSAAHPQAGGNPPSISNGFLTHPLPTRGGGQGGGAGERNRGVRVRRRLQLTLVDGARRVLLDGKSPQTAADYLLAVRAATFSPDDLFLVKEYPSSRRRFLDRSVFHTRPGYLELVNRCRAAVKQLNAAMRAGDAKVVASWEEVVAPLAAQVSFLRRTRAERLAPAASELYGSVLGAGTLGLVYKTMASGGSADELSASYRVLMEKRRPEGMRRGYCLVGPHADDLAITLSGRAMKASASRGQGRLALMALVLADAAQYMEDRGEYPVLLLDDVAAELDGTRRAALLDYIAGMGQALISSTDPDLLGGRPGALYKVVTGDDGGRVYKEGKH
jgi:DNA replication and repair protein RecF